MSLLSVSDMILETVLRGGASHEGHDGAIVFADNKKRLCGIDPRRRRGGLL